MTFAQLRAFATVARLGSVKAAARSLGISEPAVSEAMAALRREFDDQLATRANSGMALTPGGERLAAVAAEILGLADEAHRAVREVRGESLLRVAATSEVHEHVATPLLEAFTRRTPNVEVALQMEPAASHAGLLTDRRTDVTLGARPGGDAARQLDSLAFLRYRLVIAAAPSHPLARRRDVTPAALGRARWLVGPSGVAAGTMLADFLAQRGLAPSDIRVFPTHAAATAAASVGSGLLLSIAHTIRDELRRRALVTLDVRDTPVEDLFWATLLPRPRQPQAASAFRRFITTPEATQAILNRSGGVPAERFRPRVYVTLWS